MAGGTAEIREHVTRLEELVGVPPAGEETNPTLLIGMEEIWSELQSLRVMLENHVKDTREHADSVIADVKALADDHKARFFKLDAELGILNMAVHSSGGASGSDACAFKTLQLNSGLKKGEMTYLAMIFEKEEFVGLQVP
ncbi:hypothetical protein LguiA_016059 [Lonicera macranthoides]